MVSTSPWESSTTPLPSRAGPRVRFDRASGTALLLTLTTDSWSTVSSDWGPAGGGATRGRWGAAAHDEALSPATSAAQAKASSLPRPRDTDRNASLRFMTRAL